MPTDHIVSLIDEHIAQLQEARTALMGLGNAPQASARGRGRPKRSANKATEASASAPKKASKPAKRTLTAEGKARIAEAQKRRWAAQKQAAEPATRKYAVKPKVASKAVAPAKKTAAPEAQPAAEASAAGA